MAFINVILHYLIKILVGIGLCPADTDIDHITKQNNEQF